MSKKTGALKHVHKYFKRYDGLWACNGLGGCTHYMPKNMAPLPVGQLSICWKCEKVFMMVQYHMESSHPMCDECMEIMETIPEVDYKPKQQFTRISLISPSVQSSPITDSGHDENCDLYIGGICTCHLST